MNFLFKESWKKYIMISALIIITANQHNKESCDTEEWSNGTKNSALPWYEYIKIENSYFKL